jgi:predicted phage-related endonuclease
MQVTPFSSSVLSDPVGQKNKNDLNLNTNNATNSYAKNNNVDSDTETKPDTPLTQQELVAKIKELQNKINIVETNEELTPEQREVQLKELNEQLDDEVNAVQRAVKSNVSSMINSLFSMPSNNHSGMLFNNKA